MKKQTTSKRRYSHSEPKNSQRRRKTKQTQAMTDDVPFVSSPPSTLTIELPQQTQPTIDNAPDTESPQETEATFDTPTMKWESTWESTLQSVDDALLIATVHEKITIETQATFDEEFTIDPSEETRATFEAL